MFLHLPSGDVIYDGRVDVRLIGSLINNKLKVSIIHFGLETGTVGPRQYLSEKTWTVPIQCLDMSSELYIVPCAISNHHTDRFGHIALLEKYLFDVRKVRLVDAIPQDPVGSVVSLDWMDFMDEEKKQGEKWKLDEYG